jgi:hypothetical protein
LTRDYTGANRVTCRREYDRDDLRRPLGCSDGVGSFCDNDFDVELDELGCNLGIALAAALCPAIRDCDVATLDPTQCAQSLNKGDPIDPGPQACPSPESR